MSFRVDDLKGKMPTGGARANLFKVILNNPLGDDTEPMSFLCKGAALPASIIGQIDVPFRGRQLKVAGDRTFENWTVTIINENDFAARGTFEKWMNLMNKHVSGEGDNIIENYTSDLVVQQLDRNNQVKKEYDIVGAFPVNLSAIDLSYDTTDAIEEFTVEFAYQYWTENLGTVEG